MDFFDSTYYFFDFSESFISFFFSRITGFFDFYSEGILSYWPFFLIAAFSIIFIVLRGIIYLINDLQ